MRVSHIIVAMLVCVSLTPETNAGASPERGRSSTMEAGIGKAVAPPVQSRDVGVKAGGAADGGSTRAGVRTGGGSKGRNAAAVSPRRSSVTQPREAGPTAPSADRRYLLLNAQAHGRLAQPSRSVGSTGVAAGRPGIRGSLGVGSAGQPGLAASTRAAVPPPLPTVTPRASTIGGPRVQGFGRVDGRAFSRTTRGATDGAELRHKF